MKHEPATIYRCRAPSENAHLYATDHNTSILFILRNKSINTTL